MSKQKRNTMMPTRRDVHFKLPAEKISDWHPYGPHVAHLVNTLSLFFPVGERFFIESVRNYRGRITDPELKKAVTAFIGQEAMHGREHDEYNKALFAAVPETVKMERFVANLLALVQKTLPKSTQLSATIALEHFTAILADQILKDPRVLEGADPAYAALLRWHALEETEHKAVAFDVWRAVTRRSPREYVARTSGLILATAILWSITFPFHLRILRAQGRLTDLHGWRQFWRGYFGEIGLLRKLVLPWADYFRPDFHPWDHDNRHLLKQLDGLTAQLQVAA
ncbi:MAG: metal-dependent hydrolase [Stenotrophobium sp.]